MACLALKGHCYLHPLRDDVIILFPQKLELHLINPTYIYQQWRQAPLKGVTQITVIIVFNGFIYILVLYIFPHLGFIRERCFIRLI